MRLSAALYRLLLYRYPRRLRDRYGAQMLDDFRLLLEEAVTERRGPRPVFGVWKRVLAEWFRPIPGAPRRSSSVGDLVGRTRIVVRSLFRSPGFTLPALLVLAVGMTACTAIFTVVDAILFRPLALPQADRIVVVCEDHPRMAGLCNASPGNVADFAEGSASLEALGIGRGWPFALATDEGSQGVRGGLATAGFLSALGARTALGRVFRSDEHGPDRDDVALLSHSFWLRHFGADAAIIGRTIRLDGEPATVIGVLASDFEAPLGLDDVELWRPPHFDPLDPEVRGWRGFAAVGRLASGSSLPAAEAELTGIYTGLAARHDDIDADWRLRVEPLLRVVVGDTRPILLAFLAAAGILLLIVCANVANLVLARGLDRARELSVRTALGADRRRLIGDILLESVIISAIALGAALILGRGVTEALLRLAPPQIPRLDEVALDARVFAFVGGLSILATALFALLPAFRVTANGLAASARAGGGAVTSPAARRLRSTLVTAEVALAVVLVATAGVLTRSFVSYLAWDPGFERESLVAVSAFLDTSKHEGPSAWAALYQRLEARLEAVPGVVAASTASAGPLFGGGDGATPATPDATDPLAPRPDARWFDVGPEHFATLGVEIVEGEEFSEAQARGTRPVALVNEALAAAAWPDGSSPVGRRLQLPELELDFDVVGVVADVPPVIPGEPAPPEVYWANRQLPRPATFVLIRTRADPSALLPQIEQAFTDVDPDLSVGTPRSLTEAEGRALVRPRFQAVVLLAMGLAGIALAWAGVYAVVSYSVAQRERELGIRMALGARARTVVRAVLRASLVPAFWGVALGMGASVLAVSALGRVVQGLDAIDPGSILTAGLLLLGAALLAAAVPALRIARTDPVVAMRSD